jgi:hypothetical protein
VRAGEVALAAIRSWGATVLERRGVGIESTRRLQPKVVKTVANASDGRPDAPKADVHRLSAAR